MRLIYLHIHNFKSIQSMEIRNIDRMLIFVGKNNTGKASILDAVRAVYGCYEIQTRDPNENRQAIRTDACSSIEKEDLHLSHRMGIVSQYKRYGVWCRMFSGRLPSSKNGRLSFILHMNQDGKVRHKDLYRKSNPHIHTIMPHIYRISAEQESNQLQNDLLMFQEDEELRRLRFGSYIFERVKKYNYCSQCVGLINQRKPEELSAFETARLLEFKIYQLNLIGFSRRTNGDFFKSGGYEEIQCTPNFDADQLSTMGATAHNRQRGSVKPVELMGKGTRSIYMLFLLETYISEQGRIPSTIAVGDPEIFLHPQLQRSYSEILYRLSKKNQVVFKTYSPGLLFNSSIHRIRQAVLDDEWYLVIRPRTNINEVLDDLGYGTNDLSSVSSVSIVEGKQDKSRLPLLLEKYCSEIYDEAGNLYRISIITTNSYTNIRTYTNLKYINRAYLRDQFLTIRDEDGKDPEELASQLCRYYDKRNLEDVDCLSKVTKRDVLTSKYYSFGSYPFDPTVMVRPGVVESEGTSYQTLYGGWREYLYQIRNEQQPAEILGRDFSSPEDIGKHTEKMRAHLRGHSLYDIFYGPFREEEKEILRAHIDLTPKEGFKNILNAVDRLAYLGSRKKPGN